MCSAVESGKARMIFPIVDDTLELMFVCFETMDPCSWDDVVPQVQEALGSQQSPLE